MRSLRVNTLKKIDQHLDVLDLIPDLHVWAKNRDGQFVYGNRLFRERFGFLALDTIVGKDDYDLAPYELATNYVSDDAFVLAGGKIIDRLERILRQASSAEWFLTSKWPIQNHQQGVIGTLGMSRHLDRDGEAEVQWRELQVPVDLIDQHFDTNVSMHKVARASNVSISTLERRFKRYLRKTPHQYLTEVRLERGRQLLASTNKSIGMIAAETGFTDHSHFTKGFTKHYGITPSNMRRRMSMSDPPATIDWT